MTDALDPVKVEALRAFAGGEPGWVTRLYAIYDADTTKRIAALREVVAAGDAEGARNGAHGIRGASDSLGAHRVVVTCHALEDAARRGDLAALPGLVDRLAREVEELRHAVPLVIRGA